MILIPFYIQKLHRLSRNIGVELIAVRDDLLPVSGGGNKVRKGYKIIEEASRMGCNAVVTTGGTQSNHARVVSILVSQRGWPCKLVLHGDSAELGIPKGNLLMMQLAGAEIEIVSPEQIGFAMDQSMKDLRNRGYTPYEIPGGGHCIEGSMAYYEAVQELWRQCSVECWQSDWIILASGTGTTQAGIILGLEAIGWKTKVIGISVARKNPLGKEAVELACSELREYLNLNRTNRIPVDFRDDWVGMGYESADEKVFRAIKMAAETEGLILDPTYTGKAFSALLDLVENGEIPRGSKVLFWHTGGIFNLMASDYIKDILQT